MAIWIPRVDWITPRADARDELATAESARLDLPSCDDLVVLTYAPQQTGRGRIVPVRDARAVSNAWGKARRR